MHRLPSAYIINKFRIASLLVIVTFLSIPVTLWMLLCGFYFGPEWFLWAGVALSVLLGSMVTKLLISGRLRCPLCMMPPLANRGCARHRNAYRLFGSYKLAVAGSILLKDSFRCPYCGEPTAMQARMRGNGLNGPDAR